MKVFRRHSDMQAESCRVVHFISGLGTGGAEGMLIRLAAGLKKRGFTQYVVSLTGRGPAADQLENEGIAVTCVDLRRIWRMPIDLVRAVREITRAKPHIIQGWMYHGDIAATLMRGLVPGWRKGRLIWGIRASDMDGTRYGRLVRLCARLSPLADVIVANSKSGADFHVAQGYRAGCLTVIPNGIDTAHFQPCKRERARVRGELSIPVDACVAIHVARVDAMKDHETSLAAVSMANVIGIYVGDGTAALVSGSDVRLLGRRTDVDRLYAAADIVISTSSFGEGFSNGLAEGMSSGLVPVATDVGDASLIVGDTGVVVSPRDAAAFAAALSAEARRPSAERRARGLRARQRIVDTFALDRMIDAFAQLYRSETT